MTDKPDRVTESVVERLRIYADKVMHEPAAATMREAADALEALTTRSQPVCPSEVMAEDTRAEWHTRSQPGEDAVERVARALATADGKDPDAPAWIRYPGAHTEGICWRDQYSDKAIAAIQAMRNTARAALKEQSA